MNPETQATQAPTLPRNPAVDDREQNQTTATETEDSGTVQGADGGTVVEDVEPKGNERSR